MSKRARKYKPLSPDDSRHGTENGYSNLRCHCDRCKAAHAEKTREMQADRESRTPPERVHGTPGGYGNWRCKCGPCRAAWSKDTTERRKRANARKAKEAA